MQITSLASAIALAVLLDTAWVALFRARPVGKFKVLRNTPRTLDFVSNHGAFRVNADSQTLQYATGRQRGILRFSEIEGLAYRADEQFAVLEELFLGFDLSDVFGPYRDTVDWFSIAAVTADGRRIPLYLSGQYTRREFLLGWYIDVQAAVLERLGLLVDVEARSREALDLIRSHLGQPKLL